MIGILFLVMALLIFLATIPAIKELMNTGRGCRYLNCQGYIDADSTGATCSGTNNTYVSTLETDSLGCIMVDLIIPILVLGVLAALIFKVTHGKAEESYGGSYPQGY